MEVYISELDIETYRGIKNLKMENLAPINIITGDNNSGKTSVLELLQSVKNPGSFRVCTIYEPAPQCIWRPCL